MLLCIANCRCHMCLRTKMHIIKKVRKNDPKKQTRSRKTGREIDATAALAQQMKTPPEGGV